MRVRRSTLRLVVIGIAVLVIVELLFDVEWQAVAAVAAAVGAVAACRAACASERTSRDALLALALAIRPEVEAELLTMATGGQPPRFCAEVLNRSLMWDAMDVEVEVRFRDGTVRREHRERLGPSLLPLKTGDVFVVDLAPPFVEHIHERVAVSIVRWSDARRICRWEARTDFHYEKRPDGGSYSSDERVDMIGGPGA